MTLRKEREGDLPMVSGVQVARQHFRRRLGSETINPLAPACQNVPIPDRGQAKSRWSGKPFAVGARNDHVKLGIISAMGSFARWVSFWPHWGRSLAKIAAMCNPNRG